MAGRDTYRDAVLAARLAAQRLSVPAAGVVEATRHLLAVQAQDSRAARLALRARSESKAAADVDHALTVERSLVITWVNRGTLHLIAAEDEPLLHMLTTPQLRTGSDRRLRQEGVTSAATQRGIKAVVKALRAHGAMTRSEVRAVLERNRVPVGGQAMVHILYRAAIEGLILRGPMLGTEHAFVLAADWLGERPKLERNRALAELARRYLVGHGPAADRDLAKWAQLPLRDARTGLQGIANQLVQRPDGLVDLRRKKPPRPPAVRLLGPFDPLLLGWSSREFVVGGADAKVAVGGMIKAIALVDGRAAGTWTMPGGRVHLDLWREQTRATMTQLARDAAAVENYLEVTPHGHQGDA